MGAFYNQAGSGQWYLGDFDYSGMVDDSDVTLLGAFYSPSAPALSPDYLSQRYGAEFAAAFTMGQQIAVPEPVSLVGVGIFSFGLLARRRTRRRG